MRLIEAAGEEIEPARPDPVDVFEPDLADLVQHVSTMPIKLRSPRANPNMPMFGEFRAVVSHGKPSSLSSDG